MPLATLTTKGQVTIPKEIRVSLKLQTGDKIEITVTEKQEAIIRPVSKKVDELFELYAYYTLKSSNILAEERGQYSVFEGSEWSK